MPLTVTSSAFEREEPIPHRYTCDAEDISPRLAWDAGPPGTVSYAVIMDDPDAPVGIWIHWVAWNISSNLLEEGIRPEAVLDNGICQGTNSWKRPGYGGPCPPTGTHRYFFKVYALDTALNLKATATKQDLIEAMGGHILAQGELMGTYAR